MVKVCVIGGGIAGLTAAYELKKAGVIPTVFEKNQTGSGMVESEALSGFILEHGAGVLVTKPTIMQLLAELRIPPVYPNAKKYKQFVWCNGAPAAVPKSLPALVKTKLLSTRSKLKLLRSFFIAPPIYGGDDSIGTVFDEIIGEDGVANLLTPALQGVYGGDPRNLSFRSVMPELFNHLLQNKALLSYAFSRPPKKMFLLPEGLQMLTKKLREGIEVRNHQVTNISWNGNAFELTVEGKQESFSHVVIATHGAQSGELLKTLNPQLSAALSEIHYAPLASVYFSTKDPLPFPESSFGILFPPGRADGFMGAMFTSELFPHVAPAGEKLVRVMIGGAGRADAIKKSEAELYAVAQKALENDLKITGLSPLSIRVWPFAIPQYEIGHHQKVSQIVSMEKQYTGTNSGICYIGAELGGVGVADRVHFATQKIRQMVLTK